MKYIVTKDKLSCGNILRGMKNINVVLFVNIITVKLMKAEHKKRLKY